MKSLSLPLILTSLFALSSCGHVFTKSDTYDTSSSVTINGAKVSTGVKPIGGGSGMALSAMIYMAGSAKLEGPFRWRIEAEGLAYKHAYMVVHRLKVETSKTKRKEWYSAKKLGYQTDFISYKKQPGKSYAMFQLPGKLAVDPAKDGDITIFADVTVKTQAKKERKLVKFFLPTNQGKREREFLFFPAEIVQSFGKRDPREWQSEGW